MVANILKVVDQKRLEWELRNIRLALDNEAPLLPTDYLRLGDIVEVVAGPFQGLQGLIDRVRNDGRLVLQVDAFGGAVGLEIDRDLLARV